MSDTEVGRADPPAPPPPGTQPKVGDWAIWLALFTWITGLYAYNVEVKRGDLPRAKHVRKWGFILGGIYAAVGIAVTLLPLVLLAGTAVVISHQIDQQNTATPSSVAQIATPNSELPPGVDTGPGVDMSRCPIKLTSGLTHVDDIMQGLVKIWTAGRQTNNLNCFELLEANPSDIQRLQSPASPGLDSVVYNIKANAVYAQDGMTVSFTLAATDGTQEDLTATLVQRGDVWLWHRNT